MKKFALFKYQPSGAQGVLKRYGKGMLAAAAFFAAAGMFLLANGELPRLNSPSGERYPVRGVDVSVYQGRIDWKTLAEQGISFAFIKEQKAAAPWTQTSVGITVRPARAGCGSAHIISSVSTAMGLHKLRTLLVGGAF